MKPLEQYPKTRAEFPATDGWIVVQKGKATGIDVVIEPYGLNGSILSGTQVYVHLMPEVQHPSTAIVSDNIIQIYCADAIYRDNVEVIDVMD